MLESLHPMGGVPVEAGSSAVGMVVVAGPDEAGHSEYYYLLSVLLLKVCIAFLCWFGLGYLLLLVVIVLGGCYMFL